TPLFVSSDEKFDDASVAQSRQTLFVRYCPKETLHEVRHAICVQNFSVAVFIVHENRLKFTAIENIMTMERRDYHDSGYFSA
ncbi:hypothetical protein, partial [Ruminococcus callidus]|uniref:hypothetical protein n=1 Tax=Ruminococcus callidus TaxID=40519 RepID=UPI00399168D0